MMEPLGCWMLFDPSLGDASISTGAKKDKNSNDAKQADWNENNLEDKSLQCIISLLWFLKFMHSQW